MTGKREDLRKPCDSIFKLTGRCDICVSGLKYHVFIIGLRQASAERIKEFIARKMTEIGLDILVDRTHCPRIKIARKWITSLSFIVVQIPPHLQRGIMGLEIDYMCKYEAEYLAREIHKFLGRNKVGYINDFIKEPIEIKFNYTICSRMCFTAKDCWNDWSYKKYK